MQKRREIEERTLDSSNRSLGLLYESERAGAATAEELNRQKEQLKRTEERLDDINSTLKTSERHLQVLTIRYMVLDVTQPEFNDRYSNRNVFDFILNRASKVFLEE